MQHYQVGDKVDYVVFGENPGCPEGAICRGVVKEICTDIEPSARSGSAYSGLPRLIIQNEKNGRVCSGTPERVIRKVDSA
eukprot:CAMPEP_0196663534 /NCGR_PEP_ID=MMETSP1086-20130531/53290_1 /TAXON_ID=77921 /ORGANISM="Cyanoptyche  gloeocystis , Strain SAG4.97" /LENGTH=79 /DNA_ID=CAMNT_0041999391 /DNA_START=156 /DNA_END=395 /DNA_ORIENTATION=+